MTVGNFGANFSRIPRVARPCLFTHQSGASRTASRRALSRTLTDGAGVEAGLVLDAVVQDAHVLHTSVIERAFDASVELNHGEEGGTTRFW